jgi:hypothetical protein
VLPPAALLPSLRVEIAKPKYDAFVVTPCTVDRCGYVAFRFGEPSGKTLGGEVVKIERSCTIWSEIRMIQD